MVLGDTLKRSVVLGRYLEGSHEFLQPVYFKPDLHVRTRVFISVFTKAYAEVGVPIQHSCRHFVFYYAAVSD